MNRRRSHLAKVPSKLRDSSPVKLKHSLCNTKFPF